MYVCTGLASKDRWKYRKWSDEVRWVEGPRHPTSSLTMLEALPTRGTKDCRNGQQWLGVLELVACCFEPFKGLCQAFGQ